MSKSFELDLYGHNSIYGKSDCENYKRRKFKIYFSIPESTNNETGLLLFISGFGANASSNIYSKMREEFSDKYNLVTLQCDYFGYEFMQDNSSVIIPDIDIDIVENMFSDEDLIKYKKSGYDFGVLLEISKNYELQIDVNVDLKYENILNFNDMGIMQAIDNITGVLQLMNILYNNNYTFNAKKVIIYGHSHGAYLAYLCNSFAPTLFSSIIDNSSWLFPLYLKKDRILTVKEGKRYLAKHFSYLGRKIIKDYEIVDLNYLYASFENKCKIISFHGDNDTLIGIQDKEMFCNSIKNCSLNIITKDCSDNSIFKSNEHGLGANFINLFEEVNKNYNLNEDIDSTFQLNNFVKFSTQKYTYIIDYTDVLPKVDFFNIVR